MTHWVDTHCHLHLSDDDPAALVSRAATAGVAWMVNPGTDVASSEESFRLAKRFPGVVFPTAGLHPHEASRWPTEADRIAALGVDAMAIGECGLDFYRNLSSPEDQLTAFRDQVRLAERLDKPLIVHCRDAFAEVHDVLETTGCGPRAVLHCWTGGPRWTKRFVALGVTFSFAGPVAFETGDTVRRGAAEAPPDRTMVETDSPYLTPPPDRRAANEPANVVRVGAALAEVWGIAVEEVAALTTATATRCFAVAEPLGRAETRELLERHGIRLRRDLGQHFLVEPNVVRRIVEIAGVGPGSNVVEIGAGAGTLTRSLAASGARVIAYEIDESLRPVLAETVGDAADLRFADAGDIDFDSALPAGEWVVVANLPYNVGTPIVLTMLRSVPRITRLVVMLQREAVDRLVAEPGSRVFGLPSVIVRLNGTVRTALRVPAHVFFPEPKVESSVAVIDRGEADPAAEAAIRLAGVGFGQRRKMLRSSLRGVATEAALVSAGIEPTLRAENLAPDEWLRLARVLA